MIIRYVALALLTTVLYTFDAQAQTAITARQSIMAYSETLGDTDKNTLRLWTMRANIVADIGIVAWQAETMTSTSELTVRIVHSNGEWKCDTLSRQQVRNYDTVRTIDLASWIDSDSLMNIVVVCDSRVGSRLNGKIGEMGVFEIELAGAHNSQKPGVWNCFIAADEPNDPHFPTNEFRGGMVRLNAITGVCLGGAEAVSVEDNEQLSEPNVSMTLAPNPAHDIIYIATTRNQEQFNVHSAEIVNVFGEVVATVTLEEQSYADVSMLPTGSYMVRYGNQYKPFIVVH